MPTYSYIAVNPLGRKVRGKFMADNEQDLEVRLSNIRLDLVYARLLKERKTPAFGRVKLKDMIVLCMHLEQLDRAGVPLHDSLADVRDSTESPKLHDVLAAVYESVKAGKMFSQALAEHPRVFNEVFVGLVAAGEKTGNLSEAFAHLCEHLKWSSEIRRKMKKATRYPVVLLGVIGIVISVLMLAVVPKLVDFIINQGFSLPIHTRALIAVSGAFQNYWYLILGLPVTLIFSVIVMYKTSESFAYQVDNLLLNMPVFGPVIRKIDLARFTHFFSVMFNSGIDILDSLNAARGVVANRVLQESIDLVRENVTGGSSLTTALMVSNQFPSLVLRMFKVGEDSGNMTEALENVNFFYNREVNDAVDGLVGMIQPALTVVMGVLIFWVIAAVFGPLYESFSKMKF